MPSERWVYALLLVIIYYIYKESFDGAFVWDDRSAVVSFLSPNIARLFDHKICFLDQQRRCHGAQFHINVVS